MAVTVKENVNPEIMLEPKDIQEEPPPRPETSREGENDDARNARLLRDKLARDRVLLENEERRTAEVSFQKVKCVTYERYKLFTRMKESGESLEAYHAALTAQAARSELGTLENEIVCDLFISKMKNMTLQDTLTFETLDPEEVLKRAIKFEHSKLTTMAFQKTNPAATGGTSNNYTSGVRIKQEPVMAVRNLSGTAKDQNRRETNKRQNNIMNNN